MNCRMPDSIAKWLVDLTIRSGSLTFPNPTARPFRREAPPS